MRIATIAALMISLAFLGCDQNSGTNAPTKKPANEQPAKQPDQGGGKKSDMPDMQKAPNEPKTDTTTPSPGNEPPVRNEQPPK